MGAFLACGKVWVPSGAQYDDPRWLDAPGDRPPLVPSLYDDEFSDGAIDAKWSWRNQGGAAIAEANGREELTIDPNATVQFRIREQTLSAGDFTASMKVGLQADQVSGGTDFGFVLVNSTNGRILSAALKASSTAASQAGFCFGVNEFTSVSAFSSSPISPRQNYLSDPTYLRIQRASDTISFWTSMDGLSWVKDATTRTQAAFLTAAGGGTVDRIGFAGITNLTSGNSAFGSVYWFRVTNP